MKRKTKFMVIFATAAITFGTLAFTVGRPHYMHYKHCVSHNTNTEIAGETK